MVVVVRVITRARAATEAGAAEFRENKQA